MKKFENYFDDDVLSRGYAYYENGAILSVEQSDEDEKLFDAEVRGREIYNVSVGINGAGEMVFADCDCPYEYGYCKHIAAVLYHIRDNKLYKRKPSKNAEKLSELIARADRKQLENIILEHAKKDKTFRSRLKMLLSESTDLNKYISDFKRAAHRYFTQDNGDIDDMCSMADIIIAKADKSNSPYDIVSACTSVISIFYKEMEDTYYDNEEGWDFFCKLDICEDRINKAASAVIASGNTKLAARVWQLLINAWDGDDDYSGEDRIFPALMRFAAFPEYRRVLEEKLNEMKNDASEYYAESIDKKLYNIVKSYDTQEDINKFIYDHISNSYFRNIAIDNAILAQNYTEAERLALDGESADRDKLGLVKQWITKRHDIYKLNGDDKKREELCRRLILMGENEYYDEWKSLVPEEKLSDCIEGLLDTKPNYSYEFIVDIENMTERLFELCCKYQGKITEYYTKLKGTEFDDRAIALYEKYLWDYMNRTSDRAGYRAFCGYLKGFARSCGNKRAMLLADELRREYCRRPAFLDEMGKAGF